MPTLEYENQVLSPVCGVDEVGRGPWAGPVVACAAIIKGETFSQDILDILRDSKKLSEKKRLILEPLLKQQCYYSIAQASVEEIDSMNILKATMLAMKRAVEGLEITPKFALIDGTTKPDLQMDCQTIVKGDDISLSIAAASVLAKQYRDRLMADLSQQYPYYGWHSNSGYGTKAHQQGLHLHGVTCHHRKSFAPIRVALEKQHGGTQ